MKKKIVLFLSTLIAVFLAVLAFSVDTYAKVVKPQVNAPVQVNAGSADRAFYKRFDGVETIVTLDELQSYYLDYKAVNGEFPYGNIKKDRSLVQVYGDDPIISFVPKSHFVESGDSIFLCEEYGYFIHTETLTDICGYKIPIGIAYLSYVYLIDFDTNVDSLTGGAKKVTFEGKLVSQNYFVTLKTTTDISCFDFLKWINNVDYRFAFSIKRTSIMPEYVTAPVVTYSEDEVLRLKTYNLINPCFTIFVDSEDENNPSYLQSLHSIYNPVTCNIDLDKASNINLRENRKQIIDSAIEYATLAIPYQVIKMGVKGIGKAVNKKINGTSIASNGVNVSNSLNSNNVWFDEGKETSNFVWDVDSKYDDEKTNLYGETLFIYDDVNALATNSNHGIFKFETVLTKAFESIDIIFNCTFVRIDDFGRTVRIPLLFDWSYADVVPYILPQSASKKTFQKHINNSNANVDKVVRLFPHKVTPKC